MGRTCWCYARFLCDCHANFSTFLVGSFIKFPNKWPIRSDCLFISQTQSLRASAGYTYVCVYVTRIVYSSVDAITICIYLRATSRLDTYRNRPNKFIRGQVFSAYSPSYFSSFFLVFSYSLTHSLVVVPNTHTYGSHAVSKYKYTVPYAYILYSHIPIRTTVDESKRRVTI